MSNNNNNNNASTSTKADQPTRKTKAKGKAKGGRKGKAAKQQSMSASLSMTRDARFMNAQAHKPVLSGFQRGEFVDDRYPMNSRVKEYLDALARPFDAIAPRCPVGYNPMPTYASFPARTYCSDEVVVPAGAIGQFTLFAGHSTEYDADEMDGPSYHSTSVSIRRGSDSAITIGTPGPISSGVRAAIFGAYSVTQTAGVTPAVVGSSVIDLSLQTATINPAGSRAGPLLPNVTLPFDATQADGDHSRWKNVGLGFRCQNVTPVASRGGQFISVQPDVEFESTRISDYSRFKTYNVYKGDKMSVSLIPKPYDQCYWHTAGALAASVTVRAAAMIIWFYNSTATAQTISFQTCANWEISGNNVKPMVSPCLQVPAAENIINPTVAVLQNSTHSAEGATQVAEVVHATQHPMWDGLIGKIENKVNELGPRILNHLGNRAMEAAVPQLLSLV